MINLKKYPIVYGTVLLSFSGLFCRGIGFFYRLFVSRAFGEEAMGIFQLTSPVLMLAFSLTCGGIQTAISRYTAAAFGKQNDPLSQKYLFAGCCLSLSLSVLYSILIYGQAENISIFFLQEKRCAPLLKICALSFPFSALHACFNGYFYGKKETKIPAFSQIAEQLVRVGTVFVLYYYSLSKKSTPSIALTCVGMVWGEAVSFFLSFLYFLKSTKAIPTSYKKNAHPQTSIFPLCRQLLSLSLPLTFSRVLVNFLQSYEAVLLPLHLKTFGYSNKASLSIYGVLTGMALSLVMFPSTFANSVSVLLLPAVSEASAAHNHNQLQNTIKKSLMFSLLFGSVCTVFFHTLGRFLGDFLFHSSLAGTFIRQLSFLCPFLYLHITLASILNGLKKTGKTLLINTFSLLIRLFFILYFVPEYGAAGYLWGLLSSELFSSLFCILLLRKYLVF